MHRWPFKEIQKSKWICGYSYLIEHSAWTRIWVDINKFVKRKKRKIRRDILTWVWYSKLIKLVRENWI